MCETVYSDDYFFNETVEVVKINGVKIILNNKQETDYDQD